MTAGNRRNQSGAKKQAKGGKAFTVMIVIIMIAGIGILLYPTFSNWWNLRRNESLIGHYDAVVSDISDEDYEKILEEARQYNAQHTWNTFTDVFEGEEEYLLKHPYDQLLDPTGSHIMGYIEIPKIHEKLAIGHGTGTTTLERGVGHVEGTSLPIGGPGCHSVLAGHRGLPSARIFSDLDLMEKGDKFFLYILRDTLAYEVDQIEIVEPDDDSFLQIEKDKDLCTLLTCTPYGINSHRMLVRGHRIPFDPDDISGEKANRVIADRDKTVYALVGGIVLLLIILLLMRIVRTRKAKKAERSKAEAHAEQKADTGK